MKVLQLIDSLRPGGAEKMAVNIANALVSQIDRSYLCCTRQEGLLKQNLKSDVDYFFLKKKYRLDLKAIIKLRKYINNNNVDIVHAHSTSFFLAGLLKLSGCKFKLIWHDHYGESQHLEERKFKILKFFSALFNGVITVNSQLKNWAKKNLKCPRIIEINNFIPNFPSSHFSFEKLGGEENDFKIICVANLRQQKDHLNLIGAFEKLYPEGNFSLHLLGEDPGTSYSASVLTAINNSIARKKIFYYGVHSNILAFLEQSDLGVLSSRSEGLPLALLEYGFSGLPVVSTNVGKCAEVIETHGMLVPAGNSDELYAAIKRYYESPDKRNLDSKNFHHKVRNEFSELSVILIIIGFYKSVIK